MPKPRKAKKKPAKKATKSFKSRLIVFGIKVGIVGALVWLVVALGYYTWALSFDLKAIEVMPERSAVYDKDGKFYSRLAGENRVVVPFDKVSNDFVNALLAREDTRFYSHHGIDPIGILRAIVRNFIQGGFREGASTITQQLARNSFPLGGKNLHRKLIEAALAYRIETELTKEEILEAYMNRIYFGSGYYGVEVASRAYFGKPASRMNLPEAAMLAGLIRSPNRFSPFANLKRSVRERNMVLERMEDVGLITAEQKEKAMNSAPNIASQPRSSPQDNWAMDTILRELDLVLDRAEFDEGGLNIYTTLDASLQQTAEESVKKRLAEVEKRSGYPHKSFAAYGDTDVSAQGSAPWLEAAVLAMDTHTGGIRVIVGGRDYSRSKFQRALLGQRQIGSAVKPFVYAKAIEAGLDPREKISDDRLTPMDLPREFRKYNPDNSDDTYRGLLPAWEGLVESRNTMTVRVGMRAGIDPVANAVTLAGISKNPPRFPSLFLGAFESNLKDLTAAYTCFPNDGVRLQPYLIERVTDNRGNVLYKATRGSLPILSPMAARMTTEIMEDVINKGTAASARGMGLRQRAAGKTGTTNNFQDAWFVGFDAKLTCGVWAGFDQPKKIMTGGYASQIALPIWVDVMTSNP